MKVLEHSKEYPAHPLDIMLCKKTNAEYSLFDGANNHFIVIDLGEFFFLKNIKISVDNFDCSLKNFRVFIKNEIGKWEDAGNFVCAQYSINPNLQEFNINKETQFVKIEFIDNWGYNLEISSLLKYYVLKLETFYKLLYIYLRQILI